MRVSTLFFVAAPVAVMASAAADFAPHANMRRLAFPQANNGNGNSTTHTTHTTSTGSTSTGSTSVSVTTSTGSGSSTTGSGSTTGSTTGSGTTSETTGAVTATTTNSRKMSTFVTVIEPTRSGEEPVTSTMVVVADETGSTNSDSGSSESASNTANPSTQVGAAAGLAESVSKWTLAALAGAVAFGIAA